MFGFTEERLTDRELDVVGVLHDDPSATNREIGVKLNISARTVRMHVSNVCKKRGFRGPGAKRRLMRSL